MSGRFDLFHTLESEKQLRIINAAFDEFGKKGYKNASTNEIVEKAGIGKGMLFYYFGSKKELFEFLCEYAIEYAQTTYLKDFSPATADFIDRYRMMTELKRKAMLEMPEIILFFESMYLPGNAEYFTKFQNTIIKIRDHVVDNLYGGIDYSLFREDIEPQLIVKYIRWLIDGYEADLTMRVKTQQFDLNDATTVANEWERFYSFLDELKKLFYRRAS